MAASRTACLFPLSDVFCDLAVPCNIFLTTPGNSKFSPARQQTLTISNADENETFFGGDKRGNTALNHYTTDCRI